MRATDARGDWPRSKTPLRVNRRAQQKKKKQTREKERSK